MKLSTWRSLLTAWLQRYLVLSTWELRRPETNEVTGHLPPLRNLGYLVDDPGQSQGSGTQDFLVTLRYPRALKYHQLPLNVLEGAYQTLAILLVSRWEELPLTSLAIVPVSEPLSIQETGDSLGEWMVQLLWSFDATWLALPESSFLFDTDPEYPGLEVSQITAGVWRQKLPSVPGDRSHATLDFTKLLMRPE